MRKSFDSFCPMGPWLVTPDELDDPDDLALGCTLNGAVVQEGRTREMLFPVPELIAHLSGIVTLLPGDLIPTGTPQGVGPVVAGETMEVIVEGIGTLSNPVV